MRGEGGEARGGMERGREREEREKREGRKGVGGGRVFG